MWATIAFGIATIGGTLASIGLLLRKKWAKQLFIISLIALVAQFVNWLFIQKAPEVFPNSYTMPITVTVMGILLVLYTQYAMRKGWIT